MDRGHGLAGGQARTAARKRVVVVTTHPIQYQVPLWRALTGDARIDPFVLYLSRHGVEARVDPNFGTSFAWDVDLLSGYPHRFLGNMREGSAPGGFMSYLNPSLPSAVRSHDPDAVLFAGLRNPSAIAGLATSRLSGIPCVYRAESSVLEPRGRKAQLLAKATIGRVQAVAPIGTSNDRYYQELGVPAPRRFLMPYTVDNDFFQRSAMAKGDARAELDVPADDFVVLFSGKLVPWKNPFDALDACARVSADRRVRLLVAGDGPLRAELERRAAEAGVALTVLGFVNQSGMGRVYSAADALVLPSELEPWGLVVNEAMNFGLPVLVSSRVGAHLDLVREGENGAVFAPGDVDTLASALTRLVRDPELARRWGERSRELIAGWGIPETVDGLARAVAAVSEA